jgi:2-furoate---CoA ligase
MLNAPGFRPEQVASVRKLGFAGAPMHDALLLRLAETFSPELFVNHYGSSEIYTYAINQQAVKKPGSAGRQGLNARLRVVPFDSGDAATDPAQTCMPRQEGQIICDMQSDEAFEGYWKRPEVNARSIRDGWFFTGDTGYFDEDGELYVTGRVDDMIISAGENISPVEIESVLSLHERIDEVAVVGLKDERLGQKVVAFIKPVKDRVAAEELDAHCRDSDLMNFKRPREYIFVKNIPKSPVGKILRRLLVAGDFEPL